MMMMMQRMGYSLRISYALEQMLGKLTIEDKFGSNSEKQLISLPFEGNNT